MKQLAPSIGIALLLCIVGANGRAQSPDFRIFGVLWTRDRDHYTLQVLFPKPASASVQQNPVVTVWFLGADGATIPASRDALSRTPTSEISYSVPLSSGQSAVAVALKINDDYFVEKLHLTGIY
jgi:hypothetical protein